MLDADTIGDEDFFRRFPPAGFVVGSDGGDECGGAPVAKNRNP